jgi:hypothetical protein
MMSLIRKQRVYRGEGFSVGDEMEIRGCGERNGEKILAGVRGFEHE